MAYVRTGPLTRTKAIVYLVLCIVLGTLFLLSAVYFYAPVELNEAVPSEAEFSTLSERRNKRGRVKEIMLDFTDHERIFINPDAISDELEDFLYQLTPGTTVQFLIHPNSSSALSLHVGETEILNFEDMQCRLAFDSKVCCGIAAFFYLSGLYMAIWLIAKAKRRKRR